MSKKAITIVVTIIVVGAAIALLVASYELGSALDKLTGI